MFVKNPLWSYLQRNINNDALCIGIGLIFQEFHQSSMSDPNHYSISYVTTYLSTSDDTLRCRFDRTVDILITKSSPFPSVLLLLLFLWMNGIINEFKIDFSV